MKSRTKVCASLLMACLPWLAMAQSDDLYFIPKKEAKTEVKTETPQVKKQTVSTAATVAPATTVVVRDVKGQTRDIDEYNRRYTSRDNTFSYENDTLYIEEKPYNERGEWVNGFEGTQDDYEYAMRIVRFRSPGYAIPISSPLYYDVVYGALPSWDWNVYDDGLYAYVFPTYSNPMWWDWRWNWSIAGPRWGFSWGWHSPWHYSSWYSPWYYSSWYSPYWYGGYWGGYWGHHHHWHHPHYAWGGAGGWHRPGYSDYRPTRYQTSAGSFTRNSGRYVNSTTRQPSSTINRARGTTSTRRSSVGRVVQSSSNSRAQSQSVRPGRSAVRGQGTTTTTRSSNGTTRSKGVYTRPSIGADRTGSSYNRPSSTRRSVNAGSNNSYNTTRQRSNSYNRSSNSGSYNRSSGSSVSRSSGGGGSVTRSSGGGGRRR